MSNRTTRRNTLYRSRTDKVIFGVCGGLAEHFDLAPWGVRLGTVLLTFFTFPILLFVYIVMGIALQPAPVRPEFRDAGEAELWDLYQVSRGDAIDRVRRRFETLDKRLQRLETIVTSPRFGLEEEYRHL